MESANLRRAGSAEESARKPRTPTKLRAVRTLIRAGRCGGGHDCFGLRPRVLRAREEPGGRLGPQGRGWRVASPRVLGQPDIFTFVEVPDEKALSEIVRRRPTSSRRFSRSEGGWVPTHDGARSDRRDPGHLRPRPSATRQRLTRGCAPRRAFRSSHAGARRPQPRLTPPVSVCCRRQLGRDAPQHRALRMSRVVARCGWQNPRSACRSGIFTVGAHAPTTFPAPARAASIGSDQHEEEQPPIHCGAADRRISPVRLRGSAELAGVWSLSKASSKIAFRASGSGTPFQSRWIVPWPAATEPVARREVDHVGESRLVVRLVLIRVAE